MCLSNCKTLRNFHTLGDRRHAENARFLLKDRYQWAVAAITSRKLAAR